MTLLIFRPNAAGDNTGLTPSAGANWQNVDEATADEDATLNSAAPGIGVTLYDLYNLPASAMSGEAIRSVTVWTRSRHTGVIIDERRGLKVGGTEYWSAWDTITSTYANRSRSWDTNPKTGVAWSWADVDALQIGVAMRRGGTQAATGYVTQVWVVVDYVADTDWQGSPVSALRKMRLRMRGNDTTVDLYKGPTVTATFTNADYQAGKYEDVAHIDAAGARTFSCAVQGSLGATSDQMAIAWWMRADSDWWGDATSRFFYELSYDGDNYIAAFHNGGAGNISVIVIANGVGISRVFDLGDMQAPAMTDHLWVVQWQLGNWVELWLDGVRVERQTFATGTPLTVGATLRVGCGVDMSTIHQADARIGPLMMFVAPLSALEIEFLYSRSEPPRWMEV